MEGWRDLPLCKEPMMARKDKKPSIKDQKTTRREFVKRGTTIGLLPYVAPVLTTFLIHGEGVEALAQGQRCAAAIRQAVAQARRMGLRPVALVQAVQRRISP